MAKAIEKVEKAEKYESRLKTKYKEEVIPALQKTFKYKNIMEVPTVEKIILNMRLGDVKDNEKSLQNAVKELELIAGQKAIVTKAKKSVANFKLRQNMKVGAKVTIRGTRMWDFLDKLISIALPVLETSEASAPSLLTEEETMRWA